MRSLGKNTGGVAQQQPMDQQQLSHDFLDRALEWRVASGAVLANWLARLCRSSPTISMAGGLPVCAPSFGR